MFVRLLKKRRSIASALEIENLTHCCLENVEISCNNNNVNFSVNIFIYFAIGV